MARKNGKTEVVENVEVAKVVEVIETAEVIETNETPEVVETETETAVAEVSEETEVPDTILPDQLTGVEIICNDCDDLDIEELKQVIDYCANRIDELQKEEVEALEEQMRAIQDKLLAMRGFRGKAVSDKTEEAKRSRTEKVVINPENPSQIYRFGKVPSWLTALCEKTGKQVWELRTDKTANSPLSQVTW
jgi:GTPase involved in cell partitioning and DNA repair